MVKPEKTRSEIITAVLRFLQPSDAKSCREDIEDALTEISLAETNAQFSRRPLYAIAMHGAARTAVIESDPEAKAAAEAIKTIDEQEQFAALVENTVLQSTADMVDFVQAASFIATAAESVAAA